jgi:hypothetical protein
MGGESTDFFLLRRQSFFEKILLKKISLLLAAKRVQTTSLDKGKERKKQSEGRFFLQQGEIPACLTAKRRGCSREGASI